MDPYHIGNLDHPLGDWLIQSPPDHDAVSPELGVINDYLDDHQAPVTHDDLAYLEAANGWVHPQDSNAMADAAHLLDAYGVPHHNVESGTVDQILAELHDGHRVIVGLPSDHLAPHGPLHDFLQSFQERLGVDLHHFVPSQHALAIKSVDHSDPAHPQIVLYDPKHADGPTHSYSLEAFTEAMKGSELSFVATDSAPGALHVSHPEHHLLSKATGLTAAAVTLHATGSTAMAVAAERLVESATDVLWDSIMKSI